jgi:hypothetical protein
MIIDHCYFINLAQRTDRLAHIKAVLHDCPWPVSRIEATRLDRDPAELGLHLLDRLVEHWHVASIWLSHRAALQAASATRGDGAFVILEDDVQIAPEFWQTEFKPRGVRRDWECLLISPRYRQPGTSTDAQDGRSPKRGAWVRAPYGGEPVLLRSARKEYVVTGAHFAVFRSRAVVGQVLDRMAKLERIYDVDLFYATRTVCYGIQDDRVWAGGLGSDHGND